MKNKEEKKNNSVSSGKAVGKKTKSGSAKKRSADRLKRLCWRIIPVAIVCLLVLDAIGAYVFNTERLLVLGVGILVVLLPCFSEISIKDLTVRRNKPEE